MRAAFVAMLMLCACSGSSTVITPGAGGGSAGGAGGVGGGTSSGGGGLGGSGGSGGSGGGAFDPCPDSAKTVYVVAADRTFSSFDPKTKTFHDIGTLSCPVSGGANPFSMAVSRDAFAYVLYENGELFKVSTADLSCTLTAFSPGATYRLFGMGFSTDVAGGTTDTLFIAGGQTVTPMSKLGRLPTTSFTPTGATDLGGWPELTGTGDAQLWGFFPIGQATPFVARIDKNTGNFTQTFDAPALSGSAQAWAFAFWGASFWIFYKRDTDASTKVWEMKAGSGAVTEAIANTNRSIVGAGVSTCAPVTIN